VNDSGSCEVDDADSPKRLGGEGGQEAVRAPDGVYDDGVHPPDEHDGVAKVGGHLTPFGQGTGNNRGGCRAECVLEQPKAVIFHVHKKEVRRTDEGFLARQVLSAERESVPV